MENKSKWFISGILLIGAVVGILFLSVVVSVVNWAGTTEFCGTFCHDMEVVYTAYKKGQHARTPSGKTANCSDCHLAYHSNEHIGPVDYVFMLVDKAKSGSVSAWGFVRGRMNTVEKQVAMRPELIETVHNHMKHQDFSTCRGCHNFEKMYNPKKPFVAQLHKNFKPGKGVDCLACHPNVGHYYGPKDHANAPDPTK